MPTKILHTELDDVDRAILAALQADGRISNARLAEATGIAPSTAHARLRAVVARGVLRGVAVDLDPEARGLGLQALISIGIRAGARGEMTDFLARISALPGVVQAFFLGGSEDFIVHIAVRDSDAVRDFVVEHLSADPVVSFTRTSLVFDHRRRPLSVP
ncbi:MAG: Lrp/AsnC family transcriptional regulator [Micrococcales bacterium]|nr:Lrp/AsnC family transcriptional regulator [Micrococcales bacterium]